MKTVVFLSGIVSALGQNFIQTHTGSTLESGQSIACHYITKPTIGNTQSGTMTTTWFSNYVAHLLDWDGSYNYADVPPNTGSNGATYEGKFTEQNADVADNDPQSFNYGTKPVTILECQQKCLNSDNCMVANHEDDSSRAWMCNLQAVCGNPRKSGDLPTGRSLTAFVKLKYSTFTALDAKPGHTCVESAVFGPSTLGKSTPVNPVDCHAKCALELRAPYFMIDRELRCTCYDSCTHVLMAGNVDAETAEYSTVFHTSLPPSASPTAAPSVSPTNKPTRSPTPPPTDAPTFPPNVPTPPPTNFPTGIGETRSPTRFPTTGPPTTAAPTTTPPPTTPAADDDNNDSLIIGGMAGGGVMIVGGYAVFKYFNRQGNSRGRGGGQVISKPFV